MRFERLAFIIGELVTKKKLERFMVASGVILIHFGTSRSAVPDRADSQTAESDEPRMTDGQERPRKTRITRKRTGEKRRQKNWGQKNDGRTNGSSSANSLSFVSVLSRRAG